MYGSENWILKQKFTSLQNSLSCLIWVLSTQTAKKFTQERTILTGRRVQQLPFLIRVQDLTWAKWNTEAGVLRNIGWGSYSCSDHLLYHRLFYVLMSLLSYCCTFKLMSSSCQFFLWMALLLEFKMDCSGLLVECEECESTMEKLWKFWELLSCTHICFCASTFTSYV